MALLLGVFSGCLLLHRGNFLLATARTFDSYLVNALADREHAGVVLFTLLLGGSAPLGARTPTYGSPHALRLAYDLSSCSHFSSHYAPPVHTRRH